MNFIRTRNKGFTFYFNLKFCHKDGIQLLLFTLKLRFMDRMKSSNQILLSTRLEFMANLIVAKLTHISRRMVGLSHRTLNLPWFSWRVKYSLYFLVQKVS